MVLNCENWDNVPLQRKMLRTVDVWRKKGTGFRASASLPSDEIERQSMKTRWGSQWKKSAFISLSDVFKDNESHPLLHKSTQKHMDVHWAQHLKPQTQCRHEFSICSRYFATYPLCIWKSARTPLIPQRKYNIMSQKCVCACVSCHYASTFPDMRKHQTR